MEGYPDTIPVLVCVQIIHTEVCGLYDWQLFLIFTNKNLVLDTKACRRSGCCIWLSWYEIPKTFFFKEISIKTASIPWLSHLFADFMQESPRILCRRSPKVTLNLFPSRISKLAINFAFFCKKQWFFWGITSSGVGIALLCCIEFRYRLHAYWVWFGMMAQKKIHFNQSQNVFESWASWALEDRSFYHELELCNSGKILISSTVQQQKQLLV